MTVLEGVLPMRPVWSKMPTILLRIPSPSRILPIINSTMYGQSKPRITQIYEHRVSYCAVNLFRLSSSVIKKITHVKYGNFPAPTPHLSLEFSSYQSSTPSTYHLALLTSLLFSCSHFLKSSIASNGSPFSTWCGRSYSSKTFVITMDLKTIFVFICSFLWLNKSKTLQRL